MIDWVKKTTCDRECFANRDGICWALSETPKTDECPFRRTDITLQKQYADIALYNSTRSLNNG